MRSLACLFCALLGTAAVAAPPKPAAKPAGKRPPPTELKDDSATALLKPYDRNGDWQIDVEEFSALETDFRKAPKGPLARFDKGKDGELDAMIDRTFLNTTLGGARTPPPAPKKPGAKKKPKPDAKPAAKPGAKPGAKPAAKPAPKPDAKPDGTES